MKKKTGTKIKGISDKISYTITESIPRGMTEETHKGFAEYIAKETEK